MSRNIAINLFLFSSQCAAPPNVSSILEGTNYLSNSLKGCGGGAEAYPKWQRGGPL